MHRSVTSRRVPLLLIGLLVCGALAAGVATLFSERRASAAPSFNAWGTVRCTMSGTNTMKPGLTYAAKAGTVESFRANLTCSVGSTGQSAVTVKSGRITATSVPASVSCSSATAPAMRAEIKWTANGGKVEPTTISWSSATNGSNPHVTRTYAAPSSTVSGSYARGGARAVLISDATGQAACGTKAGMKSFRFSGIGGASTFEIVGSPANAIELFRDDFNGTTLNLAKWRPNWLGTTDGAISKPVNSDEQACYDPRQVSVAGGSLHLNAVARSCKATNGVTYPYASGIVQTKDHFTFTYGRLEARLWTASGSGAIKNWPAFWADGTGKHPVTGELDVFEGIAGKACWHFHYRGGEPGGCASAANPSGWHTYAAEWRPGVVTYFYDGVQVGRITTGITAKPMFLILNLGVSAKVSGPVTLPSEMLVDYVRVTS